jgi:ribosomal protein S1
MLHNLTPSQIRFIEKLHPGQRASGVVKSFRDFGAMVSIGMVSGLLHNRNIRWGHVDRPEYYLRVGQKLEVMILEVDRAKHRFSVGLKQLTPDPWERFTEKYRAGDTVSGSVIRIFPFGVLLEIVSGIDALLHKSDMPAGHNKPEVYHLEETYEVVIRQIDPETRRIAVQLVD